MQILQQFSNEKVYQIVFLFLICIPPAPVMFSSTSFIL